MSDLLFLTGEPGEVLVGLECSFPGFDSVRVRVTPQDRLGVNEEQGALFRAARRFYIDVEQRWGVSFERDGPLELWGVRDKFGAGHYIDVRRIFGFPRLHRTGGAA